jgi:acetyl-CoA carboxylase biotin carboxyl carrier protein
MDSRLFHDLELLIDAFRSGQWKDVSVRGEGLSVRLAQTPSARSLEPAMQPVTRAAPPPQAAPSANLASSSASETAIDPAWLVINAPNIGTFYRAPKPGAAPFVENGQSVDEDTELCLIEVMKLFTSVRAPVAGTIMHIAAQDGALVEGDQPLMYIQPG